MAELQVFRRSVAVKPEHGLHIRPCTLLAQLAIKFQSRIRLTLGSRQVDAKSILDLMTLAAGHGAVLELEVEGSDAAEAFEQVCGLFDTGFETAPASPPTPAAV